MLKTTFADGNDDIFDKKFKKEVEDHILNHNFKTNKDDKEIFNMKDLNLAIKLLKIIHHQEKIKYTT